MRTNRTPRRIAIAALMACASFGVAQAPAAASILNYTGECVPFARAASGIQIYGNAWSWWDQAEGKYRRGSVPKVGAVLVFAKTGRLPLGHVSVVSRIVEDRVIMITHANWSRFAGERGHAEQDVTLFDVSERGDWSRVKVWYRDNNGLGVSEYPVYGFIYGQAASSGVTKARPFVGVDQRHPGLCRVADRCVCSVRND